MKKISTLLMLIVCAVAAQAQGIEFTSGTWAEIQAKAKEANKPIFIDVYTSWCGPCKKMAKETFTQPEAGEFFNANFINYKIDAEKGEGIEIAKKYQVTSYPTCLFIAPSGKTVSMFLGYKTVPLLLREGKKAVANYAIMPELEQLDAQYVAGNRDKAFLKNYLEKRNQFGEKGGKMVTEYISLLTPEEVVAKENGKWIQMLDVYDKAQIQSLIDRLKAYSAEVGQKKAYGLNHSIMIALGNFVNQAIADDNEPLFLDILGFKKQMTEIAQSNDDNVMSASMGGGMAYLTGPQLSLSFYMTNAHGDKFGQTLVNIFRDEMAKASADSLIAFSDAQERAYREMLSSDTISAEEKDNLKQGRGLLDMVMGMRGNLMASALFNASEKYWKEHQPATPALKEQYTQWLRYIYALDRSSKIAIAVADRLKEIGSPADGKWVLTNALDFLTLKQAPAADLTALTDALSRY